MNSILWFFIALVPIGLAIVTPPTDLPNPNGELILISPKLDLYLPLSISVGAFIIMLGVIILPGDISSKLLTRILSSVVVFVFFLLFSIGLLAFSGKITANSSFPSLYTNAVQVNSIFNPVVSGVFLIAIVWSYSKKFTA